MTIPNRRPCVSVAIGERQRENLPPTEMFVASVGFDPRTGAPCEMFVNARGKTGTDIDDLLYEMGVKVSKIMQSEDA